LFKKSIAAIMFASTIALSGCGTTPLAHTGTATITVTFPEHNANVTSSNGASCNTPCAIASFVDLSKDVLVKYEVTYTWPSGTTQQMSVVIRRSDVNQFGKTIAFIVPPNINTAERLTTNRPAAAQRPEKSLSEIFAEGWNESAAERKRNAPVERNAPVNCTTILMGDIANTNCR